MSERWPIPHAKAAIPALVADFVPRDDVRRRLDDVVAESPVTLVCAPAGYGKTLLLADWCAASGTADKIWISVDADDNDADRFWAAVVSAVSAYAAGRFAPAGRSATAGHLAEVVDFLAGLPTPTYVIIDDVHEVFGTETVHAISGLVRYLPPNVRLILSSRVSPALPLARLRLQGRLGEIGTPDLRFTHDDAATLLSKSGVELTSAQVRLLIEQTDGWAAGLRLAAHALRDVTDYDEFLTEFASNDRVTADYLVSEILAGLPSETRELLRAVSICDEVTAALAAVLSGRGDTGTILSALERETSLVVGTGADRKWFRMHPLLRSYLRTDLSRRYPERVAGLHAVAANWFAAEEQYGRAFDHAIRTSEPFVSVDLVRSHGLRLLMTGEHRMVRRALTKAGTRVIARDPLLALVSALAHVEALEYVEAETDLRHSRDAWPGEPDDELLALRGLVTATYTLTCGFTGVVESVDWRDLVRAEDGTDFEAWARLGLGWSLLYAGQRQAARDELERAQRLARDQGFDYIVLHALAALGALSALEGAYAEMAELCAESVAIAEVHGWTRGPGLALDHTLLAFARVMRLDSVAALERMSKAEAALTGPVPPNLRYLGDVVRGIAHFDANSRLAGLRLMSKARGEFGDLRIPARVLAGCALIEHGCALELGRDAHARELVTLVSGMSGAGAEVSLMHARAAFANDSEAEAEAAVREVLARSVPAVWPTTQVEARLLEAALEIRQGRRTKAREALAIALSLAEPAALIRPFRQAHPSVSRLLREQIGGFGAADEFAARVSRVLSTVDEPAGAALTTREQAVLSRLSAPGSLDELAAELSVSVNTVKTHIRAIYAKLGVNNRRAAVVVGRQLGLT